MNAIKLLRELRRPRVSETTGDIEFNGSVHSKNGCIGFFIRFTRRTKLAFAKRIEPFRLNTNSNKGRKIISNGNIKVLMAQKRAT